MACSLQPSRCGRRFPMRRALPLLSTTRFHKTKAVFTTRPRLLSSPKKKSATALHTPHHNSLLSAPSLPSWPLATSFLHSTIARHLSPSLSLRCQTANKDKYTCIPIPVTVGILGTHALEHFIGSLASSWMKPLGRSPGNILYFSNCSSFSSIQCLFLFLPKIRQISLKL